MDLQTEKEVIDYEENLNGALTKNAKKNYVNYRHGRRVLKVPLSEETLNEVTVQKYLPYVLRNHAYNAEDVRHFDALYRGMMNIEDKTRPYDSSKSNSIVIENHIQYMIEFKKGYMYGNPVKYSVDDDSVSTDDLSYLNRYMKDAKKAKKDIMLAENVYKYGNAYRMILPRIKKNINLQKESPFSIYNLDNSYTFVVYGADYREKKIFAGYITELDSVTPLSHEYEVVVYTRTHIYKYICYSLYPTWEELTLKSIAKNNLGLIPIVEFYTNSARLGICDIAEPFNDAINAVSSDSVDAVSDFVNSILLLENTTIDKETKRAVEEAGAMSIQTNDPSKPARASYLINQLSQQDVIAKHEHLIKWMYNIVGVPQPTQKSTSGGDTGEARELGGGWENANIVANQHEEPLKEGDMLCLEVALEICKQKPNCPLNELYVSDIEINFNRTRNNNIMTKTQSLQTLISMDMPYEVALNIVGLTGNTHEVAQLWEANKGKNLDHNELEKEEDEETNNNVNQDTKALK